METATVTGARENEYIGHDVGSVAELLQYDLVYLASPYTAYPHGMDRAYADVCEVSWWLRLGGVSHFSPIIYGHPLATIWGVDRGNSTFWLQFDSSMMKVCDALVIIELDGWRDSMGVGIETAEFEAAGKPIYYLNPVTLELRRESH